MRLIANIYFVHEQQLTCMTLKKTAISISAQSSTMWRKRPVQSVLCAILIVPVKELVQEIDHYLSSGHSRRGSGIEKQYLLSLASVSTDGYLQYLSVSTFLSHIFDPFLWFRTWHKSAQKWLAPACKDGVPAMMMCLERDPVGNWFCKSMHACSKSISDARFWFSVSFKALHRNDGGGSGGGCYGAKGSWWCCMWCCCALQGETFCDGYSKNRRVAVWRPKQRELRRPKLRSQFQDIWRLVFVQSRVVWICIFSGFKLQTMLGLERPQRFKESQFFVSPGASLDSVWSTRLERQCLFIECLYAGKRHSCMHA